MKKNYLFAALVIAMTSCQKEPNVSVVEESPCQLTDEAALHRVSMEEAEANVLSFLSEMRGVTRGSEPVAISSKFSKGGFGYDTKSDSYDEQPLVYIFNIGDEDGYVIASGDDRAPQILCIMDQGSFAENEELTDPAMIYLLSRIDTDYRMAVGLPIVDSEGNTVLPEQYGYCDKKDITRAPSAPGIADGVAYYDTTPWRTDVSVGTILPCTWGQDIPFNLKCHTSTGATANAGCVPVAVAQIMYHWGVNATYNGVYYDWSLMHDIIDQYSYSFELQPAWAQVQSLLNALGDSNNLDANDDDKRGVPFENPRIARTFQHFGYASGGTIQDYSLAVLKNALKSGPVMGFGCCYETKTVVKKITKILGITISTKIIGEYSTYSGGHSWVYDNYIERTCSRLGFNGNNVVVFSQLLSETLVHCNMGNSFSRYNGYYYSGTYDVEHPVTRSTTITETETNGTHGVYKYYLQMVTGIHP